MAVLRLRYVHSFVDKTGRARYYFRYRGKRWALPGEPGTSEFAAAYSEAKRQSAHQTGDDEPHRTPANNLRYGPKSLGYVIDRYIASADFTKTSASTQRRYRPILEELKSQCGGALIADLRERHIRELRKLFTSNSTADFATMLLRMLWTFAKEELAMDLGDNPAGEIRKLHRHQEPYEPWSQELLERFKTEARPQPAARLALLLLLYTGQRVSDVAAMRWGHYDGDTIEVAQVKTKTKLTIPCHSQLKAALDAAIRTHGSILTTQYGQPYSAHGLSTLVQRATAKLSAKQYTAHGLRCNAAIALAEAGCTVHEIMSITGHKTYKMALHYTQRAGQEKLARKKPSIVWKWQTCEPKGNHPVANLLK
jgi:integrase